MALCIGSARADTHLSNISSRAYVGTGESVQIAGFIIPAGSSKTVLIRAAGPALTAFGLSGVLANPTITLYNGSGTVLATNDNWSSSIASTISAVAGFSFTTGSNDSALVTTLSPGGYTVIVSGVNSTSGVALVEVYEVDTNNTLSNISTRAYVGTGENVLIAGFVVAGGSTARQLMIRGVGPKLSSYGVSGVLSDPKIELYNGAGTLIAQNDNWGTPASSTDASAATLSAVMSNASLFAFDSGSKDAALYVTLSPGAYTAVVSGVNSTTGVALAEIYDVTGVSTTSSTSSSSAPTISSQPSAVTVTTGSTASFSVTASGSSLTYQWYKDGAAIASATGSSYTISSASATDAGTYYVTVSNTAGSVTSNTATLTVNASSTSSALASTVYTAAQTFLSTLSTAQQSSITLAWDLSTARHWSNLPAALVSRNGVSWGSLSTTQKTAATALINAALSTTGSTLWTGMQAADDYLNTNGGGSSYGNGQYYIAFIGTPSSTGFWVLQLTGHHLTYNIAFNGTYKSPTPLFLGVEPKGSFTQSGTTYDPMQAQRTAVADLVASLANYSGALLSGTYSNLLFGANGSGNIDGTLPKSYPTSGRGLLYSSLSSADQEKVKTAIKAYVNTQASEYSTDLLNAYLSDSALAATYVAYAGTASVTTQNSYIRVDGPRVWIEFSVQKGVIFSSDIHYHTIWRDKSADYGGKF